MQKKSTYPHLDSTILFFRRRHRQQMASLNCLSLEWIKNADSVLSLGRPQNLFST